MDKCTKCGATHSAAALALVEFVWDSLKRVAGNPAHRLTRWGAKSRCGLADSFDFVIVDNPAPATKADPDTLAALKDCVSLLESIPDEAQEMEHTLDCDGSCVLCAAKAVIAKATGEEG